MKLVEISKKEEYYNGEIYDLTVIDDSSYCVENIPVHNCGCITSSNTSIHYPIASLLSETYEIKKKLEHAGEWTPLIIADGGIRNYSDVIKAIGILGADYVMIGGLFSKIEKVFDCTTNLRKWSENMVAYIQSAMSYTNCSYLGEFNPENVDGIIISNQTQESINK